MVFKFFRFDLFIIFIVTYVPIVLFDLSAQGLIHSVSDSLFLSILSNTAFSFLALFVVVILFRVFMEAMNRQSGNDLPADR